MDTPVTVDNLSDAKINGNGDSCNNLILSHVEAAHHPVTGVVVGDSHGLVDGTLTINGAHGVGELVQVVRVGLQWKKESEEIGFCY